MPQARGGWAAAERRAQTPSQHGGCDGCSRCTPGIGLKTFRSLASMLTLNGATTLVEARAERHRLAIAR